MENWSGDNAKILSAHLCIAQLVYGSIVKWAYSIKVVAKKVLFAPNYPRIWLYTPDRKTLEKQDSKLQAPLA